MIGSDSAYLDPGVLVGGSVNDPDPIARAGAIQKLEQLGQGQQSQPVPGLVHGAIPGLLGVATNGGVGSNGLPGGLWRQPTGAMPWQTPSSGPLAQGSMGGQGGSPAGTSGVPLPTPQPASAPSLASSPGADSMAADLPSAPAAPPPDNSPIPRDSLLGKMLANVGNWRDQNRMTLMALAGGLAGSQSIGQGIGRGFSAAANTIPVQNALNNQNATMQFFMSPQGGGLSPEMARAMSASPQMTQAALAQMTGLEPPKTMTLQGTLGASLLQWNPQTRKWENAAGGGGFGPGAGAGAGYPGGVSPQQWEGMTPAQRLATLDPVTRGMVETAHEGGALPPGRMPAIMGVTKAVYPDFSENDYTAAKNMTAELQKSSNSSMGGILSNGFSAFDHLADTSGAMVGVGSYSGPNMPGGALIGATGNLVRSTLASPQLDTAIAQEKNSALRYGQEGTKFYAATGGGEGERTFALNNSTGATVTSAAKAGFLRSEVQLMTDRMNEKLAQLDANPAGQKWLREHAGQVQKMKDNITRINSNIAQLDPNGPEAKALPGQPAGTQQAPQTQAPAIPAPAQRQVGQVYSTPRGPARWMGQGWELVNAVPQ